MTHQSASLSVCWSVASSSGGPAASQDYRQQRYIVMETRIHGLFPTVHLCDSGKTRTYTPTRTHRKVEVHCQWLCSCPCSSLAGGAGVRAPVEPPPAGGAGSSSHPHANGPEESLQLQPEGLLCERGGSLPVFPVADLHHPGVRWRSWWWMCVWAGCCSQPGVELRACCRVSSVNTGAAGPLLRAEPSGSVGVCLCVCVCVRVHWSSWTYSSGFQSSLYNELLFVASIHL